MVTLVFRSTPIWYNYNYIETVLDLHTELYMEYVLDFCRKLQVLTDQSAIKIKDETVLVFNHDGVSSVSNCRLSNKQVNYILIVYIHHLVCPKITISSCTNEALTQQMWYHHLMYLHGTSIPSKRGISSTNSFRELKNQCLNSLASKKCLKAVLCNKKWTNVQELFLVMLRKNKMEFWLMIFHFHKNMTGTAKN